MKKYIVSSFLVAAIFLSVGTTVSAENDNAARIRLQGDTSTSVKITPVSDPVPSAQICQRIDADQSGSINEKDYTAYQKLHSAGNVALADIDRSGTLTPNDFIAFQNAYASCVRTNSGSGSTGSKPVTSDDARPVPTTDRNKTDSDDRSHYRNRLLQLESLYTKFLKISNLIEKRITELEGQNIKVVEAKASLVSARAHLVKAKNAIDEAMKLHTAAGTVNTQIIASAKIAQSELVAAKKDLTAATKALRMHDKNDGDVKRDDKNDVVLTTACKKFDMNFDKKLTVADFVSFQTAFTKNNMGADMDASVTLTANDYVAFMNGYTGCTSSQKAVDTQ